MNEVKISIIVPAYNVEDYIGQCISSLVSQSLKDIEIIIVDDGSEDTTRDIIEKYVKEDNRIRAFYCKHAGLAEARNTGIKEACGVYVTFVDSDDWIAGFACKGLYECATMADADIVLGNSAIRYYEDGRTDKFGENALVFSNNQVLPGQECFRELVNKGYYIPVVWGNLYKRDFLLRNNLHFEMKYYEDEYFSPYAFYYAERVTVFRDNFYYYRQRESSIMYAANLMDRANCFFLISHKLKEFLDKEKNMPGDLLAAYQNLTGRLYSNGRRLYEANIRNIKKFLIIFSRGSVGAQYGIGTYIEQLIRCFNLSEWVIQVVELNSMANDEYYVLKNGVAYYQFAFSENIPTGWDTLYEKRYYRNVFYFLAHIAENREVYCHFNFACHHELATLFKQKLKAKIIFTLHYTDWSFELLGNKEWLMRILLFPAGYKEERIVSKFNEEKNMMLECCDRVIAIANHSLETLKEIYKISEHKITYIPNGLKDEFRKRDEKELIYLRDKYGFTNNERLIIFTGRLDAVKRILELIDAFKLLNSASFLF